MRFQLLKTPAFYLYNVGQSFTIMLATLIIYKILKITLGVVNKMKRFERLHRYLFHLVKK